MSQNEPDSELQPVSSERDATLGLRVIRSETLLHGESEVLIEHNGQFYHLRQTKSGKLILTK